MNVLTGLIEYDKTSFNMQKAVLTRIQKEK